MVDVNGATLLARSLRRGGVGPVFTLSGHQILPVYDAGLDEGLRFVDTRHEAAAVNMADAWGRLTGQPGVALVTAAPGHMNTLTAVATAWMSESPMLLLSGGTELAHVGRGGFQEVDQLAMIGPVCKAAWMAGSAVELPALVARALRTAAEGVPGPVHITLPYDVLHQRVAAEDVELPPPTEYAPAEQPAPEADVERAVELLAGAERPLLVAGPSLWRGGVGSTLAALEDETGVPAVPIDSALGLAEPSLHGLGRALGESDAIVLLAPQDFAVGFAGADTIQLACRLIQVAPAAAAIGRSRPVELGLIGSPSTVLGQMRAAAQRRRWPARGWREELEARRRAQLERTRPLETAADVPVHPLRVAATVRALLRPGDCVALDGGDFVRWARWCLGAGPYDRLTNGKLGALGSGIPFAMTAALARPAARAVAFVGDGTFGFHAMELDTAVRHGLPFVAVVGNDAGWATERHRQRAVYGPDRVVATDLLPTRYDRVAEALGAHAEHVERPEELRPALERAFASNRPSCVNVTIASVRAPSATI